MRTAASVGLHLGFPPYSTEGAGQITTWIYGPVPLYALWPAGWAGTAAGAIEVAGALNIGLVVLAVAVACAHYSRGWPAGLCAGLVAVLVWPVYSLNMFSAEHVVIFFGMLGIVTLEKGWLHTAACCAALALFSKQTAVGIALAQLLWLWANGGLPAALRHLGRQLSFGAALGCVFVAAFGMESLWHSMFVVPAGLRWTPDLRWQLVDDGPHLLAAVALAAGAAMTCRRGGRLALPALTYLCLFPPAAANFFKIGGSYGAFEVAFLWLAPALAVGLDKLLDRRAAPALVALAVAVVGFYRVTAYPASVRPEVEHYREAVYLAKGGHVWFPLNPLITLYSEGRYYPDEDGLYERQLSGHPVSRARLQASFHGGLRRVVYPWGANTWGIAQRETGNVGRRFGLLWFVVECKPPWPALPRGRGGADPRGKRGGSPVAGAGAPAVKPYCPLRRRPACLLAQARRSRAGAMADMSASNLGKTILVNINCKQTRKRAVHQPASPPFRHVPALR
jgi:hypothetical protein